MTYPSAAWMADALCAEPAHTALPWFPRRGQPIDACRAVCAACSVREPCLAYAVEHFVDEGVWGGTSPRERRRMRRDASPPATGAGSGAGGG